MREPRNAEPATARSAAKPEIPIRALPRPNASPCMVAMPMRRPVNDPGPVATAKASTSCSDTAERSRMSRRAPGSCSASWRDVSIGSSLRTTPSRATAQLALGVVVSRERSSTCPVLDLLSDRPKIQRIRATGCNDADGAVRPPVAHGEVVGNDAGADRQLLPEQRPHHEVERFAHEQKDDRRL